MPSHICSTKPHESLHCFGTFLACSRAACIVKCTIITPTELEKCHISLRTLCRNDTAYSEANGNGSSFVAREDAENAGSGEDGLGFSPSDLRQLASQSTVKATCKLRVQKFKASFNTDKQ